MSQREATLARPPGPAPRAADPYAAIEGKVLDFLRRRATGTLEDALRSGAFSARPDSGGPDMFGAIDTAYILHILGLLADRTDRAGRRRWAERILSFQADDGWFRANDAQKHAPEHSTAYALGALQLLVPDDRAVLDTIKPLRGFRAEVAAAPGPDTAPFALAWLDRLHFWRGSHRAGGLAAIVAASRALGLRTGPLLGIEDPEAWLQGWWAYFDKRLDARTGYWRLGHPVTQFAFDNAYRLRHHPVLGSMGGAVHLYWVSERMGAPMCHPEALIRTTAGLMTPSGLYEREPYCIDLDADFLIGRAMAYLPAGHPAAAIGAEALRRNRDAILDWFNSREPEAWNATSHKLPGAFAAVAVADAACGLPPRWSDVLRTTFWL